MPIELICQNCKNTLRVADEHAGKQARCPACQQLTTVPGLKLSPPPGLFAGSAFPAADFNLSNWFLRTSTGQTIGPVTKRVLDQWVTEGRVTVECQLRLGETAPWQGAGMVYPQLSPRQSQLAFPIDNFNPNPYASPASIEIHSGPATSRRMKPARGETILILGLLSLFCCSLLGPIAWWMGQVDLEAMQRGKMNPADKSFTRIGMILGIVSTLLLGLAIVLQIVVRA